MTARLRSIAARTALIVGLVGASFGLGEARRGLIRWFFIDGAVPEDRPIWTTSALAANRAARRPGRRAWG